MDRIFFFGNISLIINSRVIYRNDSRFLSPYTEHGMNSKSKDPIYFEIGGIRCRNSSDSPIVCLPNSEIDQILEWSNYRILFLDNYFDILNYDEPVVKYLMEIRGAASGSTTASNYINFNNVDLITHDGFIFDRTTQISSYKFVDRVEIISKVLKENEDDIIFFFRLEGQNHISLFDRTYVTLQEILANIGGLVKFLFLMSQLINKIYVNYLIKRDLMWKIFRNLLFMKNEEIISSTKEKLKLGIF